MDSNVFEYDIAISYASEDLEIAEKIAKAIKDQRLNVYFDQYYQFESWGKELPIVFKSVFSEKAKYCLILVSKNYLKKKWTDFERQLALARQIEQKGNYILPLWLNKKIYLDGLPDTIGYLKLQKFDQVVDFIVKKIKGRDVEPEEKTNMRQQLSNLSYEISEAERLIQDDYSPDDDTYDERDVLAELEIKYKELLNKYLEKWGEEPF